MDMMQDFGYLDGVAQEARVSELSEDQERAIDFTRDFIQHGDGKYIVIGGVAGSGKSTIIPHIMNLFPPGCVEVCAYTGKAVMNLKRKGVVNAVTLHSFLYDTTFVVDHKTNERKVIHTPRSPLMYQGVELLIVDEASMVSREMFDLIMKLPFKTLYIGDHFQLPPVGDDFNIMANPDFRLERIHRQEEGNPIVILADLARQGKALPLGTFGTSKHTRSLNPPDLASYDEVIVWTNKMKDSVNDLIRSERGFQKDVPQADDKMIVRVNNRNFNVYNGQIVYLMNNPVLAKANAWKVEFVDELAYNDPFIMAQTDSATKALASIHLPKEELDKLRGVNAFAGTKEEYRKMKSKYPCQIHLDWGYAITCHAAQGTSWGNVAVILEDRMKHVVDASTYRRWIYTAVTRAEESVTVYSGSFRL